MEKLKDGYKAINTLNLMGYTKTIFWLGMILLAVSCQKSRTIGPEETSFDRVPELEASNNDIKLSQVNFNSSAVEFSWSPGTNHGTNMAVDYTLELDQKGNNFESPVSIVLGRGVYSKSYTVADFNALLKDQLHIEAETTENIEARIKAATADSSIEPDYSNVVALNATTYKPVSTELYLIGSAAPNGWDANNATPLDQDPETPFIFTYEGNLSAGEFKFTTTLGEFTPSYNRGQDDSHLFHRTEESQPDDPFVIDELGPYTVTVNLVELTITIEKKPGPSYSKLWMVGSAVPNGWDLDNADQLRQDPGDPFLFDYNEVLSEGEFKIATEKSFTAAFYRPPVNHPDISNTKVQLSAGDPDNKWYITDPGGYKITFNMRELTISIEKFTPYDELWIVGNATPNGWNIDSPNQMQADPDDENVFTYNGQLSAGEFKFPTATGDWGTDYFMPAINHQSLDSTYVRFIPAGSPDNKWEITEAGTYSIRLNQLYETIEIQRQ